LEIVALAFQEFQKIYFAFSEMIAKKVFLLPSSGKMCSPPYAAVQHMMECTWISKSYLPHKSSSPEQSHKVQYRPKIPINLS